MRDRSGSDMGSTAISQTPGRSAEALRARIDLSLVASGTSPSRAHNKSTIDPPALESLSGAERAQAQRLAERLASSHSG